MQQDHRRRVARPGVAHVQAHAGDFDVIGRRDARISLPAPRAACRACRARRPAPTQAASRTTMPTSRASFTARQFVCLGRQAVGLDQRPDMRRAPCCAARRGFLAAQVQHGFDRLHLDPGAGEFQAARADARHQPADQRAQPVRHAAQRQAAGRALDVLQEAGDRAARACRRCRAVRCGSRRRAAPAVPRRARCGPAAIARPGRPCSRR